MKKLITIVAIAVVSLNFVSCRQDDESTEFTNTNTPEMLSNREVLNPVKVDTKAAASKEVDPDPPYKDGTRW